MPNRVDNLAVDKLVSLVWGIPLGKTLKDAGDEAADVVVDPRVGTLVVLDPLGTPRKGSRQ